MSRLILAVDPQVGVSHVDLAQAWADDQDAASLGMAKLEPANGQVFLPTLAELVVIPLAVNIASTVLIELVRRLVLRLRKEKAPASLEVIEVNSANGDRIVVVRINGLPM